MKKIKAGKDEEVSMIGSSGKVSKMMKITALFAKLLHLETTAFSTWSSKISANTSIKSITAISILMEKQSLNPYTSTNTMLKANTSISEFPLLVFTLLN